MSDIPLITASASSSRAMCPRSFATINTALKISTPLAKRQLMVNGLVCTIRNNNEIVRVIVLLILILMMGMIAAGRASYYPVLVLPFMVYIFYKNISVISFSTRPNWQRLRMIMFGKIHFQAPTPVFIAMPRNEFRVKGNSSSFFGHIRRNILTAPAGAFFMH